jgi:sulfoxide reductase heme-binding subunit YedZ
MTTAAPRTRPGLQQTVNAVPRWAVYSAGLIPMAWLWWLAFTDNLGADPVKALEHALGLWAIRFVILGLAVSPLRQLTGVSLLRFRRAIGLLAFFYALAHVAVYVVLDRGLDAGAILKDIVKRPYITVGMVAFAVLIALAITSNAAAIRRLGAEAWNRLHRWVYVAAIAAAAHFLMSVKSWPAEPVIYAALIAVLLALRPILSRQRKRARRLA